MSAAASSPFALRADHLTKHYSRGLRAEPVRALEDLTLSVSEGTVFGLLGPNGAGKTTLIKILLGVTHATSGRAELFGRTVTDYMARQVVGYLPESHRFPQHLTPAQLLDLSGALADVPAAERRIRARRLLDRVHMNEWTNTPIKKFSKGMMQRTGLAAALMANPRLVLLDEPTDGVDPVGRVEIRDLVLEMKQQGVTVFVNSHLLSEVERVCDRVAVLTRGRLITEGAVEELTTMRSEYVVQCTGDVNLHATFLREKGFNADASAEGLVVRLPEPEQINAVIDALRGGGISVVSLAPRRTSLEDVFMQLVTADGPSPVGGAQSAATQKGGVA